MTKLPDGVQPYRRTDVFTQDTVPAGLLRDHKTKAGTWGLIHVVTGTLRYRISETNTEVLLTPAVKGVIEPEVLHNVTLADDTTFFVEFWR